MAMFSKRPASLAHLSDEEAARALSRHFGNIVEGSRDLGVNRKDLRRLTWSNPAILDAAHERMELFAEHMWSEAVRGLDSRVARVRQRSVDRMFAHPRAFGDPFASALSLFAPAARVRGPRVLVGAADEGRLALEREAAAELAFEHEREVEDDRRREREAVETVVTRRSPGVDLPVAQAGNLWPAHIRRPTRGRRW